MKLPKASYLVCASPRSGTELLCRGLAGTGVAGRPQEYFLAEDPAKLPGWGFWEEGPFAAGHAAQLVTSQRSGACWLISGSRLTRAQSRPLRRVVSPAT